jgi:hypothetical protein
MKLSLVEGFFVYFFILMSSLHLILILGLESIVQRFVLHLETMRIPIRGIGFNSLALRAIPIFHQKKPPRLTSLNES